MIEIKKPLTEHKTPSEFKNSTLPFILMVLDYPKNCELYQLRSVGKGTAFKDFYYFWDSIFSTSVYLHELPPNKNNIYPNNHKVSSSLITGKIVYLTVEDALNAMLEINISDKCKFFEFKNNDELINFIKNGMQTS